MQFPGRIPSLALLALLACLSFFANVSAVDLRFQAVPAGTQLEDLPKVLPDAPVGAEKLTDAGDFYLTPGKQRVNLLRSTNSMAVEFTPDVTVNTGLQKLKGRKGMPSHTSIGQVRMRGRRKIQILRARHPSETLDGTTVLAEPTVDRAFPVLVDRKNPHAHDRDR